MARRRNSSPFGASPVATHVRPARASTGLAFGVFLQTLLDPRARLFRLLLLEVQRDQRREGLHQPVVERQRLFERGARAGLVALREREHPRLVLHPRRLGRRIEQTARNGSGAVEVAAREQAAREHELCRQVARLLGGCLLGELRGRRQVVPLHLDHREPHLRGRGARVEPQHLPERLRRGVQVALGLEDGAEQVMGLGVSRDPA